MPDAQGSHIRRIVRALDFIENQLTEGCDTRAIAQQATMSPWHFQRIFHGLVGIPVTRYVRRRRLVLATDALAHSDRSIRDVALDAGFASHEVFTRAFRTEFGQSPSAWRNLSAEPAARALRPTRPSLAPGGTDGVEILHWWTHGAEASAAALLREAAGAEGMPLRETAVLGGGGQAAVTLLEARCLSGFMPGASPVQGERIAALARRGLIHPLDDVATAGEWDRVLPAGVQAALKFEGRYYAAPIHLHRVNAMHVNLAVLRQVGQQIPTEWQDFLRVAERLRAAGVPALAIGDEPWQVMLLFSLILSGLEPRPGPATGCASVSRGGGSGTTLFRALHVLGALRQHALRSPGGREWFHASAAVARGEAAVQFMGDWARPDLLGAGGLAPGDYACAAAPGTVGQFRFVVDGFAMFRQTPVLLPAQVHLCQLAMHPEVQRRISGAKHALAARTDVPAPAGAWRPGDVANALASATRADTLQPAHGSFGGHAGWLAASERVWRFWSGEADADVSASALARLQRSSRG